MGAFHPYQHPVDIRLIEVRGLGRGKGFEVISDSSIFDDAELDDACIDFLSTITERAIMTLKLMITEGLADSDDVTRRLLG